MANPGLYTVGGTVQAGGGIYIPRPADQELLQLCRDRVFAYVLTPRQMGKSSLMVQTAEQLQTEGVRTAIVDLQDLGAQVTAEQWYFGFLVKLEDQLELETDVVSWWGARSHLGVSQRLTLFFEQVLLKEIAEPVVIFVDEIDSTLSLDFTDDFFIAIRSLYVTRATQPEFGRLSFVLVGVATPGDLIRDARRTPFNIGQRVDLTDFARVEAMPLAAGLGLAGIEAEQALGWVLQWTGGHPYLTQRLCQEMARVGGAQWTEAEVGQLVGRTFLGAQSEQDNNLQFVRDMLTKRALEPVALLKTYRQVWRSKPLVRDEEQSLVKSHLKLAGVVKREGKTLQVRNQIYRQVFDRQWIKEHLPESLWQRLKPAMPIIATLLVAFIGMTGLAIYANQQTIYANHQTTIANLRGQASNALYLLTTRPVEGMVVAIRATGESRQKVVPEAFMTVDDSLLSAVQVVRERNALRGHTGYVRSVAFSPDGKTIASGSADTMVRLWDFQGKPIGQPFQGHTAGVRSVTFSPDGKTIASASDDRMVRLWDLQGKSIGQPFQGHTAAVWSVAFSSDGKTIASASVDTTIRLWDLLGKPIGQPFQGHTAAVRSVTFSPDGKMIASASDDRIVWLWDLQGKPIGQPFQGHTDSVNSVAFSPDGKTIASASVDTTVRLWDLQGKPIGQPFQGHTAAVRSVAFSPDGKTIASGSLDSIVRLWDWQGKPIGQPFQGHTAAVRSVAFSPDGKTIASGGADNTVRLWDLQRTSISQPFYGHKVTVSSVAFSPDGKTIASGSLDSIVRLWDLQGKPIGQPFQGHTAAVYSVAFSPDGKTIASGSWDNTVRLWDLQGKPIGQPFQGHTDFVRSVAFSPDGKTIASGSGDNRLMSELTIASSSGDNTVRLWDLQGKPIGQPFQGHTSAVNSLAFSPDGKTITSGSFDNTVRLWDLEGKPIGQPFQGHTDYVRSVAFSPDGKTIASASNDNTVRLWDLEGKPIGQPFQGHTDYVRSVAFSPDGKTIASASDDTTVRLWDLQGKPIGRPFQGHRASVWSVAFSPDGKTIASGSDDAKVRLWLGNWQGWLKAACIQLRQHSVLRDPEHSFDSVVARGAREVCEQQVWGEMNYQPR